MSERYHTPDAVAAARDVLQDQTLDDWGVDPGIRDGKFIPIGHYRVPEWPQLHQQDHEPVLRGTGRRVLRAVGETAQAGLAWAEQQLLGRSGSADIRQMPQSKPTALPRSRRVGR